MSFSEKIASFGDRAAKRVQDVRKGVSLKLFSAVIRDTPVDTGRLRANWKVSSGAPDLYERSLTVGKGGQVSGYNSLPLKDAEQAVTNSTGNEDLFLSNNLPYAARVEFEGWSHTKAPEGMVRKNVVRFARLIKVELQNK